MLQMKHLSKVYRTHMVETHALRDFSIHVRDGEFVAVTGPSGSGKTTFLNIAGLLEEFSGGEFWLDGVDVRGMDDAARSKLRNEKIGFIFQSFNLIGDLSVYENVELPLTYRGMPASDRKKRVQEALEKVGMAHRMKHFPSQLSGGQQQRVAVARAIGGKPLVLLADEPTGNLDSANGEAVMGLLRDLHREGSTICMVTHDPRFAQHAERTIHLFDGRVVEDEKGEERMHSEEELKESGYRVS